MCRRTSELSAVSLGEEESPQKDKTLGQFVSDTLNNKPVRKKGAGSHPQNSLSRKVSSSIACLSKEESEQPADARFEESQPSSQTKPRPGPKDRIQKEKKKWTNSHSFTKRPNTLNKKWDEKETNYFFSLLGKFGTDFTTIQQFLRSKTVAQIKNKFNKEEKEQSSRIQQILVNPNERLSSKLSLHQQQKLEVIKDHLENQYNKKYSQQIDFEQEELPELTTQSQRKDSATSVDSVNRVRSHFSSERGREGEGCSTG